MAEAGISATGLYVEDHAVELIMNAERGMVGESFNIGGHNERTNIDVFRTICALVDEMAPDPVFGPRENLIIHLTYRPGHDFRYAMDALKMERELGQLAKTFESGLRKTAVVPGQSSVMETCALRWLWLWHASPRRDHEDVFDSGVSLQSLYTKLRRKACCSVQSKRKN